MIASALPVGRISQLSTYNSDGLPVEVILVWTSDVAVIVTCFFDVVDVGGSISTTGLGDPSRLPVYLVVAPRG